MSCCAYGCHSRFTDGKKLFSLPWGQRDGERRRQWLLRIGRADFVGTQSTRLCEWQFAAGFTSVTLILTMAFLDSQNPEGADNGLLHTDEAHAESVSTGAVKDSSFKQGIQLVLVYPPPAPLQFGQTYAQGIQVRVECPPASTLQLSETCAEADPSESIDDDALTGDARPVGQIISSRVSADPHLRIMELECQLDKLRRRLSLANRTKIKVLREHENLKQQVARYLTPEQLGCMSKNSTRGTCWGDATIRKALKVRLACGSRGYNVVKEILAPLPSLRTLHRHLELLRSTPGAVPELLQSITEEVDHMQNQEEDASFVDDVEMAAAQASDVTAGSEVDVSTDHLADTPE
ncbi:hypothetical protein HPB50_001971 [Hyalomma asiaticum]|uniref:Uncharacterized protein n=1 Tax=Hyalomma asiaticum TaxID=266040 RepID=A0ACB7RPZ0_HYAAI|nr:hypothetical protein HPB50_001971 [Hyalomma asiaticum]